MSDVKRRATMALKALVSESGGPDGGGQIKTGTLPVLKELFTERFVPRRQPHPDGMLVSVDGWHAFQELVPIADPNRWDRLRAAVYRELESDGWERINKPRGSQFVIPHRLLGDGESERPLVILTWNPDKWGSDEGWERLVDGWPEVDPEWSRWSTGNRSSGILPGDHAILLRQGRERGIVAIGKFTSECFVEPHWDEENKDGNYAEIKWEHVAHIDDRIPTEELIELVPEVPWNSLFASGVQALPEGARKTLELCRARLGDNEPPSLLPDPDAERSRLQGLESWAHYMLSSILAGRRPPGWNQPHRPSPTGTEAIRSVDEMLFNEYRPDVPDIYWEYRLTKRPQDKQNGWPDIGLVWPDRIILVELKTDPGSIRDGQLDWYTKLAATNYPSRQIDLLSITRDPVPDPPPEMATEARYANLTWKDLAQVFDGLRGIAEPVDQSMIDRYMEMLDELGLLSPGQPDSQRGPSGRSESTGRMPSDAEWLDEAIRLATATATDQVPRALNQEFGSWGQLGQAADRVRDALDGEPAGRRVQVWRWREASSGRAMTDAGTRVGSEMRFSPLRQ